MSATPPLFQAFRPVYNVNTLTNPLPLPDPIKIGVNYDIKIKDNIILWSDICTAFKNPLFVRNDGALVPFLKDENFEPRKPLRILARPNIVFEAVLEVPIDLQKPGETDSPHPASTTINNSAQGTSSALQPQNVDSGTAVAPTPDLHDLPPQYTREESAGGSASDIIPRRIGGSMLHLILSGSTVSGSSTSGTSTLGSTALGSIAPRSIVSGSTASGSTTSGSAASGSITSGSTASGGGAASGTTPLSNSLSGSSTSGANQSTTAANSNANVREVGILRYTAGQGSDEYELGLKIYFGKDGTPIDYSLAKFWISQAADLGHVAAQYYLAYMLENGQGSAVNIAAAVSGYIDAGSRGYDLNWHKPREARGNNPGKLAKALLWYGEAANRGDAKAQCVMGFLHQHDKGSPKRYSIAKDWYTKAVNQGYDNAQTNLGVIYHNGNCGARNYSKSFELYTKAALQGHARAQYNLGLLYENGLGVPENSSEAVKWYAKSAKQRFSRALHKVGTMYLDAHGFRQDVSRAFKLIRESAAQGDDVGQVKLGNMYYFGQGVNSDISTARDWWRKSADQGNAEARSNLTDFC
ncbi:hypothetical protein BGZ80_005071 [Entomortierella chlamydospora]|uniref:HCP-like protein n=1 Tax=Entomortierella chlamydospora TaxID=101097 RepID=A0A9P6T2W3_9FUNG|nr:hypothetical protein BGZ80_005071 [Entomortierella chlamydospora]